MRGRVYTRSNTSVNVGLSAGGEGGELIGGEIRYAILKFHFVASKILTLRLLLFCILKTCTNNLVPTLSVLVAWQRNYKSYSTNLIFRETGFLIFFFRQSRIVHMLV